MFIGMKEIEKVVEEGDIQHVFFKEGGEDLLYKEMYDASVTEAALDLTTLRDNQLRPICGEILKLVLKWNIHFLTDWDAIDATIRSGLNMHKQFADEKLYGKERSQVRLQDIDRIKKEGKPHGRDNSIS